MQWHDISSLVFLYILFFCVFVQGAEPVRGEYNMTYLGIVQEIVQVKYDLLNNDNNESNNMTYLDIFPEMVTVIKEKIIYS